MAFILDQVATGVGGLSPRDALLVMAINQANIAPLTREAAARGAYGALEAPAPDAERRPVSISAVAGSLGLPFETVRRRVKHLEADGVCATSGQGVIVPGAFLASPAYLSSVVASHQSLIAFYRQVRAAGLMGELPASSFRVDEAAPVRAAARLLSDYILRAAERLMEEAGDVVSALVLLGVLCASTASPQASAISVATLSQRLHIPQETVRRHVVQLVERGQVVQVGRGLLVTEEMLARRGSVALFRENAANVHRLFAGLAERGVVEAWGRLDQAARPN
jgi:DNA-binding Lrp family transcriptional regulator